MSFSLSYTQQNLLLALAKQSISHGLARSACFDVDPNSYAGELRADMSSFVTLHLNGKLRGCIGSLKAYQPLVVDVAKHAYAAAFEDPRFPSLTAAEFPQLDIEISVLSPQIKIECQTEEALLETLRPDIDGLTLEDGHYRSTFLPSVWKQIPNKQEFLRQLKLKAGLTEQHWSNSLQAYRYTTFSFPR